MRAKTLLLSAALALTLIPLTSTPSGSQFEITCPTPQVEWRSPSAYDPSRRTLPLEGAAVKVGGVIYVELWACSPTRIFMSALPDYRLNGNSIWDAYSIAGVTMLPGIWRPLSAWNQDTFAGRNELIGTSPQAPGVRAVFTWTGI